jgi:hypothetical protein
MKERTIVGGVVITLIFVIAVATKSTDIVFPAASIAFFAICIAYAEWCERL